MNVSILFQHLLRTVSADTVLEHAEKIWSHNRSSNFDDYIKTGDYVSANLKEYGLEVEEIDLTFDGQTQFGDAVLPLGWNCPSGLIELVKPMQRILGDRAETPNCIGMWSPATEECDIEAEVLCLQSGDPSDLQAQDATGKLILTPARFHDIRQSAIEAGALGVISCYNANPNDKDSVQWIASNTDTPGGWGLRKESKPCMALAITPKDGDDLFRIAESETLRVRVRVDAAISESSLKTIHTTLPGDPGENEVLLMVPLYDQGANFNAAGAATALECARLLSQLVNEGMFPRPHRTIRFLFTPKKYGSLAFAHQHKDILDKTTFALYLETGAGNPDRAWCRWKYHFTPLCQRHYTDGLGWFISREYMQDWRPQRFVEQRAFSLIGDTYYNDPAIGVPTHWLYGGTDEEIRHTNADHPSTLDRRSCIDLVLFSASLLYAQSAIGLRNIPPIAYWNQRLSSERIQSDTRHYLERVEEIRNVTEMNDLLGEVTRHFPKRALCEIQGLASLSDIGTDVKSSLEWQSVDECIAMLSAQSESAVAFIRTALESKADTLGLRITAMEVPKAPVQDERIPRRIGETKGTITLDTLPTSEWTTPIKTSPRNNVPYILSWWLADGNRTIGEIEQLLKMEQTRFRECIPAWFTFLEKHGYIEFIGEEKEKQEEPEPEPDTTKIPPTSAQPE
jgi:hypothetical protein